MISSTSIYRYDLSVTLEEFDLAANQGGFIGPQVLRPIIVRDQSSNLPRVPENELGQIPETARAPGASYRRDIWEYDQTGYNCAEHGREAPLDDSTLAVYSNSIAAEAISVRRLTHQFLSRYELDVAAAVYDPSVWTGAGLATALTNPWSDHENSTPIDDIANALAKMEDNGQEGNALVINRVQARHLIQSAQLLSRMSDVRNKDAATVRSSLQELLDVDRIIVAKGFKNTANQGSANAAWSRIWANGNAMVCKVAQTNDPGEVCIGRTILWNGDGAAAGGTEETLALIAEEYREEGVRSSVIRVRNWRGMKILFPKCGHLLSNVIA